MRAICLFLFYAVNVNFTFHWCDLTKYGKKCDFRKTFDDIAFSSSSASRASLADLSITVMEKVMMILFKVLSNFKSLCHQSVVSSPSLM